MAVSCPICKTELPGYAWTKTRTNKNWLSHPVKGWHDCPKKKKPNMKFGYMLVEEERYYKNPYKFDPWNGDRMKERRFKEKYNKAKAFCESCDKEYNLSYPCIHHLTDNFRDRKRFDEYKRSLRAVTYTPEEEEFEQEQL